MAQFRLVSSFEPKGDQPKAIETLVSGIKEGKRDQVLLGVTGSGKTFTMANIIARVGRPTLVIAPNKTLAAQLYGEFKDLFPHNAVEYFVSYYDYYQPEAYIPQSDLYIEKDASLNEEIDKMRLSATRSLLEREDVIIVASVSCIYGLGSPEWYEGMHVRLRVGQEIEREELMGLLVEIQYQRNDLDFHRGTFRVRGETIDIFPAYEEDIAIRIETFGSEIDAIYIMDPLRGRIKEKVSAISIYPATHYVTPKRQLQSAIIAIEEELKERIRYFQERKKFIEAQRIEERTRFDLEMLRELGYCHGIENYSRHLSGRKEGEPPPTLMDYFPPDSLLFIDESHIAIPQIRGMYHGDRSRKETLVEYGFRLPSALDNRPLNFEEFCERQPQTIYVSATPAEYELERSMGAVVEQIIRPTGLMDPEVELRPSEQQVDDLLEEIRKCIERNERVLVTTLTKRMAEDLTEYYQELGIKVRYLHSEIDTIQRMEILRDLRLGVFDVLIGINLLREGLDLPEVSLVAILDADKEGFLRSERSLIQTFGRAARNIHGKVILYGDRETEAIKKAMNETMRRRKKQEEYNRRHGITPKSIQKEIKTVLDSVYEADYYTVPIRIEEEQEEFDSIDDLSNYIRKLRKEMKETADNLEFEKAAEIRDRIKKLKEKELALI